MLMLKYNHDKNLQVNNDHLEDFAACHVKVYNSRREKMAWLGIRTNLLNAATGSSTF